MDSPDSGSPKSSSGRDDDYDSRSATADFINSHHPPPPLFDPFSHYTFNTNTTNINTTTNNNNNPNPPWPGSTSLRSDPNSSDLNQFINPFTPSFQQQQQPPPPPPPTTAGADQNNNNNNNNNAGGSAPPSRNPRKRSRASRRAPTTVLTTDTTNFRAMVQEFTGIPAPPSSHPSFPRPNRLDSLFGPSRSGGLAMEGSAQPPPSFLRHQRPQPPPPQFLVSNPMINYHHHQPPPPQFSSHDHIHVNNNINRNNNDNGNGNDNQNQFFSSLLQQTNPAKFTFSAASKPHNRAGPSINIGPGPEEFGLGGLGSHHLPSRTLSDLPNLISPDQGPARVDRDDDNGNAAKWRRNNNAGGDEDSGGEGDRLKPGGYDFSGSGSSNFNQVEKESGSGPENQGMVESWINSSE